MPCYRPQPAVLYRRKDGTYAPPRIFYPTARHDDGGREFDWDFAPASPSWSPESRPINLPCGVCFGCRIANARMWSLRMMHEARTSATSYFVTLTYDDDHLPPFGVLNYDHLEKFWKKARHLFQTSESSFRYFACGEYGDISGRPHYHFAGFDWNIPDLRFFKRTESGDYFLSDALRDCWTHGHVIVAALDAQCAAYIARYVTKKMHGDNIRYLPEESHDPETGEIYQFPVQRAFQSKGLGLDWYSQHSKEVWDLDACLFDNKYLVSPPRYYFKQLEKSDPDLAAEVKLKRMEKNPYIQIDLTLDRELLYQMEARKLQMSSLKRELI